MHDVVALLEDLPARHFLTGQELLLRRGQIGTVVMTYDGATFEVEFAGREGRAYAIPAGLSQQVDGASRYIGTRFGLSLPPCPGVDVPLSAWPRDALSPYG